MLACKTKSLNAFEGWIFMDLSNYCLESLSWRYAVKKFDSQKKIPSESIELLSQSLRLSPSSYGLQPWRFIIIENQDLKNELKAFSYNQSQMSDCSHLVVFQALEQIDEAYLSNFISLVSKIRSQPESHLEGYKNIMIQDLIKGPRSQQIPLWAGKQAYIAMGFLMSYASFLKIDTCAIEGLEPVKYDNLLNAKLAKSALGNTLVNTQNDLATANTPSNNYKTLAAVALGYRSPEDKYQSSPKVRFTKDQVISYL